MPIGQVMGAHSIPSTSSTSSSNSACASFLPFSSMMRSCASSKATSDSRLRAKSLRPFSSADRDGGAAADAWYRRLTASFSLASRSTTSPGSLAASNSSIACARFCCAASSSLASMRLAALDSNSRVRTMATRSASSSSSAWTGSVANDATTSASIAMTGNHALLSCRIINSPLRPRRRPSAVSGSAGSPRRETRPCRGKRRISRPS